MAGDSDDVDDDDDLDAAELDQHDEQQESTKMDFAAVVEVDHQKDNENSFRKFRSGIERFVLLS